jgi:parallel beta-helix repeat protein
MKKTFCFVGASFIILFTQFCYATLVNNSGFETDFANPSGSPNYGFWMVYGQAEIVGTSDGIIPFEGSRMLHFLDPNNPGSIASDIWQLIDISPFLEEISSGEAIAEMSARFNRVLCDSQTDTEFAIEIQAYAGSPAGFWGSADKLASSSKSIFTDGAVATWELNATELVLPVNTEFVAIRLWANENIYNDGVGAFDGHYADDVTLNIVQKPALTYYVDAADGNDDNDGLNPETALATIQAAIDDAHDGDTVFVAPGTYTGSGNGDIDFLGKAITVRSTDPNDPNIVATTIIDCNGSWQDNHGGFYFHNGEDANSILAGFTITNGFAYNSGGGILCEQSSPTITDCTISGNESWGRGRGGAISIFQSICRINNCTITNNKGDSGFGIYCYQSNPTLTKCTSSGNSRSGMVNGDSNPTLTNCTFSGNSAEWDGGGMRNYNSNPTLTNCTFSGNSSEHGGGMFNFDSNPTLTNCTFSRNSARRGGGMYNGYESSPILTNCTITDNSAESGGGMYNSNSNPTITNCILWRDIPDEISGWSTSPVVTYSDVQGTWPGEGNIDADPCFAFPNNYHLMPDSPCVDAGNNTPINGLPTTDIDGNPRPLDGNGDTNAVVDMGAYEYNPQSPSIAISASSLSFSYIRGWSEPEPQTLLIRNCGVGALHWEIIEDCNWLQVTPASGVSTGDINEVALNVDPNNLLPGYYTCTLQVRDSNAANSPVTIRVTMGVGQILRVPDDFLTIQAAIDAADDYDMVLVADGNYTGDGNRDIDFHGKPITVKSENGPVFAVIDCENEARGFYFHNYEDKNSVLDGFTITRGYGGYDGGGISCSSSNPTITNCTITGNKAEYGGGMMVNRDSSPTLMNCTFRSNYAEYEGGGMVNYNSSATVTNCTFSGNSAGYAGGGMCNWANSSSTVTNCMFSGNSAYYRGGGMYATGGNYTLINCTFAGNSALNGNALACKYGPSNIEIKNSILWDGGNEIYNNDGSTITITYSDVQRGWPGTGNIDKDPCFVEPGYWDVNGVWIDGDYHLLRTSPCIDAATDANVYTDIEGNPRPFDFPGIDNNGDLPDFDMGAYEATAELAELMLLPRAINRSSRQKRILAWLRLPKGITKDQIDAGTPLVLYPGNIESIRQYVFQNRRRKKQQTSIFAFFDKAELMNAVNNNGRVQLQVLGRHIKPGRYFYGSDTIKIISRRKGFFRK